MDAKHDYFGSFLDAVRGSAMREVESPSQRSTLQGRRAPTVGHRRDTVLKMLSEVGPIQLDALAKKLDMPRFELGSVIERLMADQLVDRRTMDGRDVVSLSEAYRRAKQLFKRP